MSAILNVTRRDFLRTGSAAGAGLVLGFTLPSRNGNGVSAAGDFAPNVFLKIDSTGVVTLLAPRPEMGQGVRTSLPMLLAEDLEADWKKIRIEQAPADKKYGDQSVGGSGTIRGSWKPLREAGAAAREMLVAAAAARWGVPAEECHAENSAVIHAKSKRKLSYGEVADAAGQLPVPKEPKLKPAAQFKLLGKPVPRVDTPPKVRGEAEFGIDVRLPGMKYAALARCPVFGGKLASFDGAKARAVAGVRDVVRIGETVAVVADNTWAAFRGRDALEVQWDEGAAANLSSAAIRQQFVADAQKDGVAWRNEGDVAAALQSAKKVLNSVYEFPYLAHATMEPQNCTAHVRNGRAELWAPTQAPQGIQEAVAKALGLEPNNVLVHITYLGGGFGRRLQEDCALEAALVSRAVGAPVKVMWTREEDMQHDFYRPASYHQLSAAFDGAQPVAFRHRVICPSIIHQLYGGAQDGLDAAAASQTPYCYDTPNVNLAFVMSNTAVPVGWWRAVYSTHNSFATECFVDEMAAAAGEDPFAFRRRLLAGDRIVLSHRSKISVARLRGVLELAATKAGWGQPLAKGRGRGIACIPSFNSYAANVAEVSVQDGEVRVHRMVCAVDCGKIVNPDTVAAQVEGSVVYALAAILKQAITIERGRVLQSNFHDFPMLRINEMPKVEVHIVPSDEAPTGVGEPAVGPAGAAVVNALFAVTGKRIRTMPIAPEELV
jgi:isoquinoline 1-oxidoreductase beta subunit